MSLDKIFVVSSGFFLIGWVFWFFFGKKSEEIEGGSDHSILISGGYQPDVIKLMKGKKTTLTFKRTDSNPCLEEFIIPDLKIKKYLPLNKEVKISLKINRPGIWNFHCGMNMYHGKLIVN